MPGPESSPSARAFLAASTPRSLGSLGLGPAQTLVGQLRGADSAWTPAARIARALRAGIGARRKLDGSEHYVNGSPALGLQNRIYICLRSAKHPQGFWTNSSQQYLEGVRCPSGDRFGTSVSHAFASRKPTAGRWSAMASPAPTPALDRAAVERLLSLLQPERSLPLTFMYPSDFEEESEWRCSAYSCEPGLVASWPPGWTPKRLRWLCRIPPACRWRPPGGACSALQEGRSGESHSRACGDDLPGRWEHCPACSSRSRGCGRHLGGRRGRRPGRVPHSSGARGAPPASGRGLAAAAWRASSRRPCWFEPGARMATKVLKRPPGFELDLPTWKHGCRGLRGNRLQPAM